MEREEELAREMKKYRLEVIRASETKLKGCGLTLTISWRE